MPSEDCTPEALVAACAALGPADVHMTHSRETAAAAAARFGADRVYEMPHMPVRDVRGVAGSPWQLIGVSASQLEELRTVRSEVRYVWHGTKIRPVGGGNGGYLMWAGRFALEKGPLDAVRAAQRAGAPLLLAGRATNSDEQDYFNAIVAPQIRGGIEHVGEVNSDERDDLTSGAAAMLIPTRWKEPFGLTAIESAMVGTPVLGYPAGATSELVSAGIGEACRNVREMAERAADIPQEGGRREEVAAAARERFSLEAQAARLLRLLHDAGAGCAKLARMAQNAASCGSGRSG